jgi:hypothetical protein
VSVEGNLWVLLRIIIFLLCLSSSSLRAELAPVIQKGVLDLRQTHLNSHDPIDLAGEWEFHWDRFLSSQQAQQEDSAIVYRYVPLPWSEARSNYPAYPTFGKATYRLRILLPDPHPHLLLRIPETYTAFNLFINGQRMKVPSQAGYDASTTKPSRNTAYIPIDSSEQELDIVFQVANYVSGTGGIWRAMQLGDTETMITLRSKQQFQMLMAVGGLGVMGLYHFILFLFRRNYRDNLWFSLFCFTIFTRSFLVGNDIMIYNIVEEFDWTWSRRIEFISFYASVAFSVVFIRELFPADMKNFLVYPILVVIGACSLIVLTQTHVIFRKTLLAMQILSLFSIFVCLWTNILAIRRRRPQAQLMLAGFLMMASCSIHDILNSMFRFDTLELASIGVIGCIVTTSIVISKRFSLTFDQLRDAQEAIRIHNEQLDQLVKEKTRDIRSIFASIPQAIFAIQRDGRLHAEFSDHFRTSFQPEPFMHTNELLPKIFAHSQLSADQIAQIISAIDFCLDGTSLSFQLNQDVFPLLLLRTIDGHRRSFEIDWHPIVDEDDHITKILICMRDTTELNELRIKKLESEKRVKIVAEILDKNHSQITIWLNQAISELDRMLDLPSVSGVDEDSISHVLRILHTQKGNARSLGLMTSANSIHDCEQQILDLQRELDSQMFSEVLASLQHELSFTQDILNSLRAKPIELTTMNAANSSTLCACLASALEQLEALAARLGKDLPECRGLDLLQAQLLRLPPHLEYTLRGVFNHLLANMMDHGLEAREERLRLGKPGRGQIVFHLHEDDQHWIMQISDDGQGLNRSAIEARLRKTDRDIPRDAEALAQMLLEKGFSTKDAVSEISGRGVGLDAVAATLHEFGGRFFIQTRDRAPGANPQLIFVLHIPKQAFDQTTRWGHVD